MKKVIIAFLGGVIVSFANASNVTAQTSDTNMAFAANKSNPGLTATANAVSLSNKDYFGANKEDLKAAEKDAKASKAKMRAMKASVKATENFKKNFKDASNATWTTAEDVIVASFNKDDIKTSVVYLKNGSFLHTLTYYPGNRTPKDVSDIVDRDFPYDDITSAVQVFENGLNFYILNLENKKKIKQVSVYNGETNLIKEFEKDR